MTLDDVNLEFDTVRIVDLQGAVIADVTPYTWALLREPEGEVTLVITIDRRAGLLADPDWVQAIADAELQAERDFLDGREPTT